MTEQEIKAKVRRFLRENGVTQITYPQLTACTGQLGYTVVEFNSVFNEGPVGILLGMLQLPRGQLQSRGFTYVDANYRMVFVHEDLSQAEKTVVLAHELGHIVLGHMRTARVIGTDVLQEYQANEFAHYLLAQTTARRLGRQSFFCRNRRVIAVVLALVALAALAGGVWLARQRSAFGEYYVTETGTKYHTADCKYIKGKPDAHPMTKAQFDSGMYNRCRICLPEE